MSFKNVFDSGGNEADSAKRSAQALNNDTPGTGDVSGDVHKLESQRDPWLVRQTAHGVFDVMDFLNPLFQKFHDVSADQRQVSEAPQSTSDMASSAMNKTFAKVQVKMSDEDLPDISSDRSYVLIATDLGQSEGLAVDPSQNKAYVADRAGQKLSAVDLATGARRVVASTLGDTGDVALDGNGTAYVTDYSGSRLVAVDLFNGSSRTIASVTTAYGVALDGTGKAYVADHTGGQLIAVDLQNGQKKTITEGLGHAAGVALDGNGKAYVGQHGGSTLYEIALTDGTKRVVTTLPGGANTTRVELDGAGKAYVADHNGRRLYEVNLADGAQRVVATGLGTPNGLGLDSGQIYVSNHQGQLWRISQRAAQALGGVGKVVA